MALSLSELVEAGLVTDMKDPHLSEKGREWLRQLESVDHREMDMEDAADLVLSTNGLFR